MVRVQERTSVLQAETWVWVPTLGSWETLEVTPSFRLTFGDWKKQQNLVCLKQTPLKTEFLCQLHINFFIQNFIPFLVPHLFPTRVKSIKEKGALKPTGILRGPSGYESFSVSRFLFLRKSHLSPKSSLSSKRQIQLMIRGGREPRNKGKAIKKQ